MGYRASGLVQWQLEAIRTLASLGGVRADFTGPLQEKLALDGDFK